MMKGLKADQQHSQISAQVTSLGYEEALPPTARYRGMGILASRGYLGLERQRTTLLGLFELFQVVECLISTPFRCLTTVYGLNVIAWGAMDFLLICNASPAMCHPTCDDPNSSRLQWIEIDSQILVALLCVPAFGFAPMRYRDLYFLLRYGLTHNKGLLYKLAGYNKDWFQWDGKPNVNFSLEEIEATNGSAEDSQVRDSLPGGSFILAAQGPTPLSTELWKLALVIWCKAMNTAFQAILAGFMWGYNRFDRPSWSTRLLIPCSFSCIVIAKLTIVLEGRRVRK